MKSQLASIKGNFDTIQKEVDRERARIIGITRELTKVEQELAEKGKYKEILDIDAPRCGEKWSNMEKELFLDRLEEFIYDCALKSGRSTLSIKYKVVTYCAKSIPANKLESLLFRG